MHAFILPPSVTNPVYEREEQITLQIFANVPGNVEVIYAEPFAPLPGRSDQDTDGGSSTGTTSQKSASGYQNLVAKSPDSGETIIR